MIDGAVVWYGCCNDIYGVVAFNSNEYDFMGALREFCETHFILDCNDSFSFRYIVEDDDEIFDYLKQSDNSMNNIDDYKLIIAVGHEIIKRI